MKGASLAGRAALFPYNPKRAASACPIFTGTSVQSVPTPEGAFSLMFVTGDLRGTPCNSLLWQEQGSSQAATNRHCITCQRPFIAPLVSV